MRHDIQIRGTTKGFFTKDIPYEDRLQGNTWSDYFGTYEPQKWGLWDSDSCWCLSAVNCLEDQLEYLLKTGQFSLEARVFFTANGFIDKDGDFALSERFLEIKGGFEANGGYAEYAWKLIKKYGCIPRQQLTYTVAQANQWPSQEYFNSDYFNPKYVTDEMITLGKKFLYYINIEDQNIGTNWFTPTSILLKYKLLQAPLQIGVPVPNDVSVWNSGRVTYDGKKNVQHEVELWKYDDIADPEYPYFIYDQYQPERKQLSKDYYIPFVHQGVVTAKIYPAPVPEGESFWSTLWKNIKDWFRSISTRCPSMLVLR